MSSLDLTLADRYTTATPMRVVSFCASVALLWCCGVWVAPSVGADQSTAPASEAGVVEERIKKEAEERLKPPLREPQIEGQPQPAEPPAIAEVRFVLKDVTLEGNTALPASVFTPLIDPYRNREITIAELKVLVSAIEQEYRLRGYLTTIAYLPPQRIEEGRVTVKILEGRLGNIVVEGNRYFNASRFLWYWPLKRGEILRYQPIRAAVVRMNAHPDHPVQLLLRPGAATGETDVVLKVAERLPLHVGSQWDDQGTKAIGRYRYGFSLGYNNLLGLDDRAIVGTVFGKRFGALYTQYLVPLSPSGTLATFGFSHSQVAPGRQFKALGVNGTSQTYSIGVSHPLLEEAALSMEAHAGFDFKESRTKQLSSTVRRERLRVLRVGPRLRLTDRWGGWSVSQESSFGIKGLGATSENNPVASRLGSRPDFFKTELQLTRLQRLPWGTQGSVSLETQLASSKLSPQEEMYVGGADSVRGYPEGDYLADSGLIARVEYLIPCAFLPAQWRLPGAKGSLGEQVQLVAFLDRGYGRLRAITGDERTSRNLMGLGGGVRFRLNDTLSARLEWGHAVGDRPLTDDSSSVLHFRIQSTL